MEFNLGGKLRGVHFGMGAIQIYCDEMECDIEGLDLIVNPGSRYYFKAIGTIVYAGLCNYCNITSSPCSFTVATVQSWIDEMDNAEYNRMMQAFTSTKLFGKTVAEHFAAVNDTGEPEENSKKKN